MAVAIGISAFLLLCIPAFADTYEIENTNYITGEISYDEITEYPEQLELTPFQPIGGDVSLPNIIIGTDDRIIIEDTTRVPYRYIGKLVMTHSNSTYNTVGTGFLVGDDLILTSAHCVYGDDITGITFTPAQNGTSKPYGTYAVTTKHVPTKYKTAVANNDSSNMLKYDYALLELSSNVGAQIGYFQLGGYNTPYDTSFLLNKKVTIAGYPGNSSSKLYRHKNYCTGFNSDGYLMFYNIDTTNGQSGSPVIYPIGTSAYYVVGIHRGGWGTSSNVGRYVTHNVYQLVHTY